MENVLFYGERGIVNGLVLDLHENPEACRAALEKIVWQKGTHTWVDKIRDIFFLVEPSFSEFGQPDLVLVCSLDDGTSRFLFVEAKSRPCKACVKNNKKGMAQTSFNSSLNGQLSLDYRLVHALSRYRAEVVEESAKMFDNYAIVLKDPSKMPRRCKKPQTINGIVDEYMKGVSLENSYFVALVREEKGKKKPLEKDYLPCLLNDKDGSDSWNDWSGHFGVLTLDTLYFDKRLNLPRFRKQVDLHIGVPYEEPGEEIEIEKLPNIAFTNFKEFPVEEGMAICALAHAVDRRAPAGTELKKYEGSYSFVVGQKTVAKLALHTPKTPALRTLLSATMPRARDYARELGNPEVVKIPPTNQPFLLVEFRPALLESKAKDTVVDVFTRFLESLTDDDTFV